MKPRVKAGAGSRSRSLSSSAVSRRREIFVAAEISSSVISRESRSRRSSSPNRRSAPGIIGSSPVGWTFEAMLKPLPAFRKDSFGASLDEGGDPGRFPDSGKVGRRGPREEGQGHRDGQTGVAQERAAEAGPGSPPRVGRQGFESGGRGLRAGGHLDQVGLGRQPVVQDSLEDPGIRVEPEEQKR